MPQQSKRVIVAGATGLIGSHCVELLSQDPAISEVKLLTRRVLPSWQGNDKIMPIQADFAQLDQLGEDLSADVAICALGTTIRQAGSKQRFYAVDHDYVLNFARAVKKQRCDHLAVVSAVGASARSPAFYNRVKGEMERDLKALGFKGLYLIRPSLLLGQREDKRLLEDIGQHLMPKIGKLLPAKYAPISGHAVAQKIVTLCHATPAETAYFEGRRLRVA